MVFIVEKETRLCVHSSVLFVRVALKTSRELHCSSSALACGDSRQHVVRFVSLNTHLQEAGLREHLCHLLRAAKLTPLRADHFACKNARVEQCTEPTRTVTDTEI